MRRAQLACAAVMAAALIASSSPASAGNPTYVLKCRGGKVAIKWRFVPTAAKLTAEQMMKRFVMTISYAKSSAPASDNMKSGTCAWLDRGMRSTETATVQVAPAPFPALVDIPAGTTYQGHVIYGLGIWKNTINSSFADLTPKQIRSGDYDIYYRGYTSGTVFRVTQVQQVRQRIAHGY